MNNNVTVEDFKEALSQLPEEIRSQLGQEVPSEIDSVGIKMELIKFVTELHKHNQGVDWETNKIKPKKILFEQIISDAQGLFTFITE